MNMTRQQQEPHIGVATLVSALMAIALAAGLGFLRLMERFDGFLTALMRPLGLSDPSQSLSPWALWSATALLSIFVAAVMLNVAGTWRRLLVWVITLVLTVFWGPVLLLASFKPEIGVAIIAVLWSGFCAMIYATNHWLPADRREQSEIRKNDAAR